MQTVLSGIRSTGHLHLGNYFGALRNFVKIQDDYNCFYFIADLHSLTTHPHPDDFHANVKTILAEYLASGLDPEKVTIFVQSDVPEVSELYVLLNMISYKGELERTTTFKDKVRLAKAKARNVRFEDVAEDDHNDEGINISAGLLTYPVLMAADILIHRADYVPVGKDQEQHLEYARVLARRFNNMYGEEVFKEPRGFNFGGELIKVPGLDGSGKMGKSQGNGIYLYDDEKTITKKVMKALTDSGPVEPNSPMPECIDNLFTLLALVSEPSTVEYFREKWNDCSIRYGDLKKQLADPAYPRAHRRHLQRRRLPPPRSLGRPRQGPRLRLCHPRPRPQGYGLQSILTTLTYFITLLHRASQPAAHPVRLRCFFLSCRIFAAVSLPPFLCPVAFPTRQSFPFSTSAYPRPAFSLSHLPKVCSFPTFSTHLPKVRRSTAAPRAVCSRISPSTASFPPSEGEDFPHIFYSPSEGAQKPHCPENHL